MKRLIMQGFMFILPLTCVMAQDDMYFTKKDLKKPVYVVEEYYPATSTRTAEEYNRIVGPGSLRSEYQRISGDSIVGDTIFGDKDSLAYYDLFDDELRMARRMSALDERPITVNVYHVDGYWPWYRSWYRPFYAWHGYYGYYDPWFYDPWYYGSWGFYGPYSPWSYSYMGWGYPWYGYGSYWDYYSLGGGHLGSVAHHRPTHRYGSGSYAIGNRISGSNSSRRSFGNATGRNNNSRNYNDTHNNNSNFIGTQRSSSNFGGGGGFSGGGGSTRSAGGGGGGGGHFGGRR